MASRTPNHTVSTIKESLGIQGSNPAAIAEAVLPYYTDDSNKTRYLSYRACGFTTTESQALINISSRMVELWRQKDLEFRRLDTVDISELRRTMSAQFLGAEFTRNMRLALRRDSVVLMKAVATPDDLTKLEHDYIKAIRPIYSAQQLIGMMRAVEGNFSEDGAKINFQSIVLNLHKADSLLSEVNQNAKKVHELSSQQGHQTQKPEEGLFSEVSPSQEVVELSNEVEDTVVSIEDSLEESKVDPIYEALTSGDIEEPFDPKDELEI